MQDELIVAAPETGMTTRERYEWAKRLVSYGLSVVKAVGLAGIARPTYYLYLNEDAPGSGKPRGESAARSTDGASLPATGS